MVLNTKPNLNSQCNAIEGKDDLVETLKEPVPGDDYWKLSSAMRCGEGKIWYDVMREKEIRIKNLKDVWTSLRLVETI